MWLLANTLMAAFVVMATINTVEMRCCKAQRVKGSVSLNGIKQFHLYIDYTIGRILEVHRVGSVNFILINLDSHQVYVRWRDGYCGIYPYTEVEGYQQCLPRYTYKFRVDTNRRWIYYTYVMNSHKVIHVVNEWCQTVKTMTFLDPDKNRTYYYKWELPEFSPGVFEMDLIGCHQK